MSARCIKRKKPKMEIDFENLKLVEPSFELWKGFVEAIREHRLCKVEDFAYPKVRSMREFKNYLRRLDDFRNERNIPKGFVPVSAFWLTDGTQYLGSGDVRHYLNESLETFGGHIGYSIRPQAWGRGLGTIQLALLLGEARKLGIPIVRITCFDNNIASARVIEKNGAVLIGKVNNKIKGRNRLTRIYEIDLVNNDNCGIIV